MCLGALVQLQDISAWGNGTEVAQLLLPKAARIRSFDKVVIPLPPKDTRTVKGVVEVPPLVIYRRASAVSLLSPHSRDRCTALSLRSSLECIFPQQLYCIAEHHLECLAPGSL